MFRLLARAIGLWMTAGAFVAAVVDGMKSIAASRLVLTSAFTAWSDLAPSSLGALRGVIEGRLGAGPWQAMTGTVLALPTWALLALIGGALLALGRPRPTPIGVVP
jgi:hypothetical protein